MPHNAFGSAHKEAGFQSPRRKKAVEQSRKLKAREAKKPQVTFGFGFGLGGFFLPTAFSPTKGMHTHKAIIKRGNTLKPRASK